MFINYRWFIRVIRFLSIRRLGVIVDTFNQSLHKYTLWTAGSIGELETDFLVQKEEKHVPISILHRDICRFPILLMLYKYYISNNSFLIFLCLSLQLSDLVDLIHFAGIFVYIADIATFFLNCHQTVARSVCSVLPVLRWCELPSSHGH